MRKLASFAGLLLAHFGLMAQSTVSTYPTNTANNGSGGIGFEVTTTTDIEVTKFENTLYTGTMSVQVWYRPGGVLHPGGTTPNVAAANGWILHETVSCVGNNTTPSPVPLTTPLLLQAGITYGIALGNASTTSRYTNYTTSLPPTFTDGILTIYVATGKGFGGVIPGLTIGSRAFSGSITYNPVSTAMNDAGVASIDTPGVVCDGTHNVVATIKNYGKNQINPVTVNWTYNNVLQTPVVYNQVLDTFGGTGAQTAQILLGSKTLVIGQLDDIKVWTSNPNGLVDTVAKNDTAHKSVMPAMAGLYTLDPAGFGSNNFTSFKNLATALTTFGICSPVTVHVAAGFYPEQVTFEKIQGTSAENTIHIMADPNNTSPVELTFAGSSTDNYLIRINNTNYMTFEGINATSSGTYSTVVRLEGGAKYNTFRNCVLTSPTVSTTSTNNVVFYSNGAENAYTTLEGNQINGGSYGIYIYGTSTTDNTKGVTVKNNTVKNAYYTGMYFYYSDGLKIIGNKVSSASGYTTGYGITAYYGYNGEQIVGNEVLSFGGVWPLYGIYCYYNYGEDTARGLVANNMIHVGNAIASSANYGLTVYGPTYTDVVYNTVVVQSSSTTSRVAYLYSGSNSRALNNNFLHYGNGYTIYAVSGNSYVFNYNNIATKGATFAYYSTGVADFTAWKALGNDSQSISVNDIFPNPDSLRTCDTSIYNKGIPVEAMLYDFDGDPRKKTMTNLGADEYISDAADFSIGDSIEFCGGTELEIGGTMNGGSFFWSNGKTTPTIIVTEEGNYSVTVDGPCATGMVDDVEVIDVNPVANFNILEGQFIGGFENKSEYGATYHWDFGDGSSSTEENPWHQYANNGPFTVTLTVMNYCDTVMLSKVVQFSVGVNEITFGSLVNVYPNPATNVINLAFGNIEDQTVQIELFDMKGQRMFNNLVKVTGNSVESMDISNFTKGIYLVKLTTGTEVATKQIIVQ